MTLTSDTHSTSLTHLASSNFETQGCNSFQKINNFQFFPYKSLCDQILPWRKMGQGQHRVIICTALVELPYAMLHTKFQGHRSIGSGEEDFLKVFTIYRHGGHVGHVTQLIYINFHSYPPQAFI